MDLRRILLWLFPLVLWCCSDATVKESSYVDALNHRSYTYRYSDIDSSLFYAKKALGLSSDYPDGKAEALNNIAYVAYQQMRFDHGKHLLQHIYSSSRNQLELLCADVLTMKIAQRLGDGKLFFDKRLQALRRIKRIHEAKVILSEHQLQRLLYAETELHIVSSTYYYYLGQDSASVAEIMEIGTDLKLESDTTQWLYYQYMMGSGGMVDGTEDEIRLQEFDYLFRTFSVSRSNGIVYFEANALQSLATIINDSANIALFLEKRPDAYNYLISQYNSPLSMAEKATSLFRNYKDLFQTACGHRTMGEILFSEGRYREALEQFQHALSLAGEQRYRSSGSVVPWMAGIHEKLSMSYAALDDVESFQAHRQQYLRLLDSSRQNKELDSRMDDLKSELSSIRSELLLLLLLIAFVASLAFIYAKRVSSRARSHLNDVVNIRQSHSFLQAKEAIDAIREQSEDSLEFLKDECKMLQMKIDDNLRMGVERRAKVSLVYSIVPYLDRMLLESRRMVEYGHPDRERLEYICELSDEIQKVNNKLTDWIRIEQGQLRLHISTFPLQNILDIIAMVSNSFQKKGIHLEVSKTNSVVKADHALTLFMVNTLVDNAGKFTPEGGTVTVDVVDTEEYVEIRIEDTGIGLSPEDVETLNNSKVYDSKKIGHGYSEDISGRKGFGFGIMNCKGIIGKYRKQSSLFNVCEFGVRSTVGKGSTFWFRLPRIVTIFIIFFSVVSVKGTSLTDSTLLVDEYNAKAVSALANHNWEEYTYFNSEALRLHNLCSQDTMLSTYCQQMEKAKSDSVVLFCLLVIFSIIAVVLFYLAFLKDRIRNKSLLLHLRSELDSVSLKIKNDPMHIPLSNLRQRCMDIASGRTDLENLVNSYFSDFESSILSLHKLHDELVDQEDMKRKLSYESENLYVRNQILDNALSTIKHETMYYPARTQQLVRFFLSDGAEKEDLKELLDLLTYYRYLYMLLYQQADMQLDHNSFHVSRMSVQDVYEYAQSVVSALNRRNHSDVLISHDECNAVISCDTMLIKELVSRIITSGINRSYSISLSSFIQERGVRIQIFFNGASMEDGQLRNLFSSTTEDVNFLVAKQIIREHDSYYHHPGLRLMAQKENDGYSIIFTLVHKD